MSSGEFGSVLRAAKRISLAESVRNQLTRLIMTGVMPPGSQLPPEHVLCSQLKVGRTSLREALQALQALNLVEVLHGKGTYVRADAADVVPYSAWPGTYQFTVHDILEFRLAIEPLAANLAAVRSEPDDLKSLAAALAAMESGMHHQDLAAMVLADLDFHEGIVEASKNPLFVDAMKRIAHVRIKSLRISLSNPERPQRVLGFHRSIFDAICQHQPPRAAETMEAHVLNWAEEMRLRQVPNVVG